MICKWNKRTRYAEDRRATLEYLIKNNKKQNRKMRKTSCRIIFGENLLVNFDFSLFDEF